LSATTTTDESPAAPAAAPPAPAKAPSRRGGVLLVVLGVVGGGAAFWYVTHRGIESTDDAQVDADVVAVPARIGGTVAKVGFTENQLVKTGDVLVELDPAIPKARLAQAEATLAAALAAADAADADARVAEMNAHGNKTVAEAALHGASSSAVASKDQIAEGEAQIVTAATAEDRTARDLQRDEQLLSSGSIAQAEVDRAKALHDSAVSALTQARAHLATLKASTSQAESRVAEASAKLEVSSHVDVIVEQARAKARAARAQVDTAKALRDLATIDLVNTKILAPEDGLVSKKSVGVGQMLAPGQPVVQLVPTRSPWVTANFKETQIRKMRTGQPAHIEVDAFPGVSIEGEVESFSAATGSRFALLPPDNASGNYTKVVQRLPVRIKLKGELAVALRPGMSVELSVDTR
jgi:membrane fusion protein (multidrug efflux system)